MAKSKIFKIFQTRFIKMITKDLFQKVSIENFIQDDKLKNLYSQFSTPEENNQNSDSQNRDSKIFFNYLDCSNLVAELKANEIISISFNFLPDYKFITYEVSDSVNFFNNNFAVKNKFKAKNVSSNSQNDTKLVTVVICAEKNCFILNSIDEKSAHQNLKALNMAKIDAQKNESNNNEIQDEIKSFFQYFTKYKKNQDFLQKTLRPISAFIIRRFFYPQYLFKDPSFFSFDKEKTSQEVRLSKTFQQKEFIRLRLIYTNDEYTIYLAIHIESLYIFALKENKNVQAKEYSQAFKREEDYCLNYQHRCLHRFYGMIKNNEKKSIGFVYEFMSNDSLDKYVNKNKNWLPSIFSMITMNRISQGIRYLQKKFLIHRDIKPSNILIDHDGLAYISDFETVRKLGDTNEMTRDIGSNRYASPEMFSGHGTISFPSDIYSFGNLIFFIFEMKNAFEPGDDVFQRIKNNALPRMSENFNEIENIYHCCIQYEPSKRPKISQIQKELVRLIDNEFCLEPYYTAKLNKGDTLTLEQYDNYVVLYCFEYFFLKIQMRKRGDPIYIIKNLMKYVYSKVNQSNGYIFSAIVSDISNLNEIFKKDKDKRAYIKQNLDLAAKKNDPGAHMKCGDFYMEGYFVTRDPQLAIYHYRKAEEKKHPQAYYKLGIYYLEGVFHKGETIIAKDIPKAISYFKKAAASLKVPEAFYELGKLYLNGIHVEKNCLKAGQMFREAMIRKLPEASTALGNLYYYGQGFEQDYKKAKYCFEKAVQYNEHSGIYKLAYMYHNGIGVDIDIKNAIKFYQLCIHINHEKDVSLSNISRIDDEIILPTNYLYINRSLNDLGIIHICIDLVSSRDYIQKAAEYDFIFAKNNYGLLHEYYFENQEHVIMEQEAIKLYENASRYNFPLAFYNLGHMEERNDFKKAIEYYEKASKYEDEPLKYNGEIIQDEVYDLSKVFIMCLTNLKLAHYYLSIPEHQNVSRNYFILALAKLINNCKDKYNQFQIAFDENSPKNPIFDSYIENFIFNTSNFGYLIENPKIRKINIMNEYNTLNFVHQMNQIKNNDKVLVDYLIDNEEPRIEIIDDAGAYFDRAINNTILFGTQLNSIIKKMQTILHTPPYNILFGRIKIRKTEKIHKVVQNINQNFYNGFDINY